MTDILRRGVVPPTSVINPIGIVAFVMPMLPFTSRVLDGVIVPIPRLPPLIYDTPPARRNTFFVAFAYRERVPSVEAVLGAASPISAILMFDVEYAAKRSLWSGELT